MAGRRRKPNRALTELTGILFMLGGFATLVWILYLRAGLGVALMPCLVVLVIVGYNMASGNGNPSENGSENEREPEYVDPDADLPAGAFERERERES